ncbi:MAG: branched chain amino acid aminotransferase, partial [Clostridia bacterium]|nr:branched chain amino acid aminotransferase [Clostridia bacterium]
MDIKIIRSTKLKEKPDENKLGFGRYFTDHMFVMDHDARGWHNARIIPYGNLEISPASTVLHYGAEIFEGLKAYRLADGSIQLFRPEENAKRMINSAERLCLPEVSVEDFMQALKALLEVEKDWVPHQEGTSLYIRPFEFADAPFLGVHAVQDARFIIILSPVGAYYAEGLNPVKIAIESDDVRAVR